MNRPPASCGTRHRTGRRSLLVGGLGLAGTVLVGCGGDDPPPPAPPPPTQLALTLTAAPDVNPDPTGRASPISVKVFILGGSGRFNSALYDDLWSDEQGALGPDFIKSDGFFLQPGEVRVYAAQVPDTANYIGVAGAYRAIDSAGWRATLPVRRQTTMEAFALLQSARIWLTLGDVNRAPLQPPPPEGEE